MQTKTLWAIVKETGTDWSADNATRLSASLAYYTVLSIAPLLVLAVSVAGLFFGEEAARGHIESELASVVGPEAGKGIQTLLSNAKSPEEGVIGTVVGLVVLLFGASGVFGELQSSMNEIWKVAPKPGRGVWGFLQQRFFSFTMVLGVAFLLLVSLVLSAVIAGIGGAFSTALPGGAWLWQGVNFLISLGLITALFALIFKYVPDVEITWRDVWMGAFVTALLFSIGKFGLALYLGRASVASPYGAAGSLIVLVIWVYYAAQILFMGAEFTQVYARHRGSRIEPSPHAVPVEVVKKVVDESGEKKTTHVSRPRTV
ncbi:MAG: Ribonuclease [Myxococcaceae bacterium]|nr:Ribonuclease [Myxococcaceae bacterium]